MASKNVHMMVGVAAGVGVYAVYKHSKREEWDFWEVCAAALLGGIMGILPDILEPAKNPHHRQVFHSLALLTSFLLKDKAYEKLQLNGQQRASYNIALGGYSSHLFLDLLTPRSLPII